MHEHTFLGMEAFAVTTDALRQLVIALYEGHSLPAETRLTDDCEFRDPVVIVRGQDRVLSMFQKLNRLYPASKVESFEAQSQECLRYRLTVHYRRKLSSKPRPFETEVEFEIHRGCISKITEDWRSPFFLDGRGGGKFSRAFRTLMGRVLS